ncbi:MAG: hypothetical protein SchgKO_21090 [Schleiferiaceae bacterium]
MGLWSQSSETESDVFANLRANPPKAGALIVHVTKPIPEGESLYITGSHITLGNWDPARVSMSRIDDTTFFHSFDGSMEDGVEFKITMGTWEREMLIDGMKGPNLRYEKQPIIYEFWNVEFSEAGALLSQPSIGKVKHYPNFEDSKGKIKSRNVWVWTPDNYDSKAEDASDWVVIIMHDGQNLIDPKTSNYGVEWRVDETADSLISGKHTRPFIVIGINSSVDRHQEYMGNLSPAYIDWVLNQVVPTVRKEFTFSESVDDIFSGGSSAGGAVSFVMHTQHRDHVGGAICMSPALFYKGFDSLTPFVDGPKKDINLYLDNGGLELELVLQPSIDFLLQNLENKGYESPKDYTYVSDPNAKHFESAWAHRLPFAIVYALRK